MIRSVSRTPLSLSLFSNSVEGSWLENWRMGSSWVEHQRCCQGFLEGLSWKFDQDRTWFCWESISWGLEGRWRFLTGDLKDGVIFGIIYQVVVAKGPILEVWSRSDMIWLIKPVLGDWRTLRIPDWRLGWWDHLWHHGSSWYMILKISWKFGENPTWFGWESISWGLGGHWGFLIEDLEAGIIFDIMDHLDR